MFPQPAWKEAEWACGPAFAEKEKQNLIKSYSKSQGYKWIVQLWWKWKSLLCGISCRFNLSHAWQVEEHGKCPFSFWGFLVEPSGASTQPAGTNTLKVTKMQESICVSNVRRFSGIFKSLIIIGFTSFTNLANSADMVNSSTFSRHFLLSGPLN